jgi:hypothetical protein
VRESIDPRSLKLGEIVEIMMTGYLNVKLAVVTDVDGTELHPPPWLKLCDESGKPIWDVSLKCDDFIILGRPDAAS